VTVFGQSAGAGSIMHQITAYGGLGSPAPFQQAILQSPGFEPFPGREEQENLTQRYLALLNVSSISAARQLPLSALSAANVELVASSPYGTFTFAPAVDGSFVPALPGVLLAQGLFDTSVKIMTGFNAHETLYFTNPDNTNNSIFEAGIQDTFPGIQPSVVDYIASTLYPPVFNGSYPYTSYFERAELTWPRVLLRVTRTSFTERSRVVRRLTDTVLACRQHTTVRTCRTPISTGLAQAWQMRLLPRPCKAISLALPSRVTRMERGLSLSQNIGQELPSLI
jgi:hypothetical protein